ncbi:MAG: hypothetical protein IPP79_12630 [Chitinophagaceae bacterium]|nr:hypothetical protein [Chitinophagaceae bacterium]
MSDNFNTEFRIAQVYAQLSNVVKDLGDYKATVEYQLAKLLPFFENWINPPASCSYVNLSSFYKQISEFEKQEFYARKALDVEENWQTRRFFLNPTDMLLTPLPNEQI